jgi:hypothetical protein
MIFHSCQYCLDATGAGVSESREPSLAGQDLVMDCSHILGVE